MTQNPQLSLTGDIGSEWPITEFMGSFAVLRILDGTRSTTSTGDNMVIETFTVYSDALPNVIQASIRAVENRLALAHRLTIYPSPNDKVQIIERVTDEVGTRKATVLGGTITPVDDNSASRTMFRGATLFVITIDRYALWEYGTAHTTGVVKSVSCHGGTIPIPASMTSGTQPGRISVMTVKNNLSSQTKKFWAGIKNSYRLPLTSFDPEIKVRDGYVNVNTSIASMEEDADALDGWHVEVGFAGGTDWARAFDVHLINFNSSSAAAVYREIYHGRYHLMLRYRTETEDWGEKFGVRAKYGWILDKNSVTNEAVYLTNTKGLYNYVDLGIITIGGDAFSSEIIRRAKLSNFGIAIQAAVFDGHTNAAGEKDSAIYLDNMQLVPADNYVHVEFGKATDAYSVAELYTHDNGDVYCLSVERDDQGNTRDSLVFSNPSFVYESAPIVDSDNWYVPAAPSKLVFVSDGPSGGLTISSAVDIQMQAMIRTANV